MCYFLKLAGARTECTVERTAGMTMIEAKAMRTRIELASAYLDGYNLMHKWCRFLCRRSELEQVAAVQIVISPSSIKRYVRKSSHVGALCSKWGECECRWNEHRAIRDLRGSTMTPGHQGRIVLSYFESYKSAPLEPMRTTMVSHGCMSGHGPTLSETCLRKMGRGLRGSLPVDKRHVEADQRLRVFPEPGGGLIEIEVG